MEMRRRSAGAVVASIVSCTASATFAQQDAAPENVRQLVEMPPLAQAIVREEMPDNLGAINELIGLLAEDRLQAGPINIDGSAFGSTHLRFSDLMG